MKRKFTVWFMVMMMVFSMLTACKKSDSDSSSSGADSSTSTEDVNKNTDFPEDDISQTRTITIWQPAYDNAGLYTSYTDNPVVSYLNNKFNMKLEYQEPAVGSETDQFNLMLGTGDYTDVFSTNYTQQKTDQELFESGVIKDITDYVKEYMPNYYNYLHDPANKDAYDTFYDSNGRIYYIGIISDVSSLMWGGLVYRQDILDTMTGGNVQFPSGNAEPTTVDDLEYMLDLMTKYFQAANMTDYAGLILPSTGWFSTSELTVGFGVGGDMYLDGDTAKFGPMEAGFYNYLVKMHEWYEKGYIYKDFASRTNDLFYLPNTALTYGGSAGVWWGLNNQLDSALSMPDYNLNVTIKAMSAPLDTEHGVTGEKASDYLYGDRCSPVVAYAISSTCSEENMIRYMIAMDYLFSEEGTELRTFGLSTENGASENEIMKSAGIENGTYTKDASGYIVIAPLMNPNSGKQIQGYQALTGMRLPGINLDSAWNENASQTNIDASNTWSKYGSAMHFPTASKRTSEESNKGAAIMTSVTDYLNAMVPKFIMGSEELNPDTWNAYVEQIKSYGIEERIAIWQAAYDRTNKK